MAKAGQGKCLCCNGLFDPYPRNINRQRYCSNTECRLARKRTVLGQAYTLHSA